ncbi:Transmembrane protease serine 13 [Bulinus truncatus]|nr:Transmembrane protease serine 13 [Bulinus truncatus]
MLLEIHFTRILSADRVVRQGQCPLRPAWAPVNETVQVFKGLYLRNFEKKPVTSYNISERYEMEMRFHFKTPCGTMDYDPEAAIVDGDDAPDKAWPWQARVIRKGFSCGGVLIDANWVLTAAHCIQRGIQYTIKFGSRYKIDNVDTVVRTAKFILVHKDYNKTVLTDDIAMIKLSSPVKFNDRVRPACLPVYGQDFLQNDLCYITGFGKGRDGVQVDTLMQLKVYAVPDKECFYLWNAGIRAYIDWRFLCVERLRGGLCHGDSGSPLSCKIGNRYYVAGIAAFSTKNCSNLFYPDGFTKLTEFMNWIFHKMEMYS